MTAFHDLRPLFGSFLSPHRRALLTVDKDGEQTVRATERFLEPEEPDVVLAPGGVPIGVAHLGFDFADRFNFGPPERYREGVPTNLDGVVAGERRVFHGTDVHGNPYIERVKEETHEPAFLRSATLWKKPELMIETTRLGLDPENPDVLVKSFNRRYFHKMGPLGLFGEYGKEFEDPDNTMNIESRYQKVAEPTPDTVPPDWF